MSWRLIHADCVEAMREARIIGDAPLLNVGTELGEETG